MERFTVGPKVKSCSSIQVHKESSFSLSLGGSTSGDEARREIASCEAFGIEFKVTDEDANRRLRKARHANDVVEVRRLMIKLATDYIAEHPEVFQEVLAEQFEAGVREGRRQKAREFQKVLAEA